MKSKKKIIVLFLQIVLIVAFVFVYRQYVEFNLQPTNVFGYARALDSGVKITERDLIQIPLSQMTLGSNMIRVENRNEVIGKYTTVKVVKGSIVYREQLGDITSVDKFASLDLSNSRVIALPISYETGVGGDFERGERLDLMFTASGMSAEGADGENYSFSYAKIFMQNVPIYQINTGNGFKYTAHADQYSYTVDEEGNQVAQAYDAPSTISLIVTPEEAEEIETRRMRGNIVFVKRFEESETHDTLGFVIGEYGKVFVGNANAETSNIKIAEAYLSAGSAFDGEETVEDTSGFGTGNMEFE
jgi:pilus assembly protein CpaB